MKQILYTTQKIKRKWRRNKAGMLHVVITIQGNNEKLTKEAFNNTQRVIIQYNVKAARYANEILLKF